MSHDGEKNAIEIPFWHVLQQFIYPMAYVDRVRRTQVGDPVLDCRFILRSVTGLRKQREEPTQHSFVVFLVGQLAECFTRGLLGDEGLSQSACKGYQQWGKDVLH